MSTYGPPLIIFLLLGKRMISGWIFTLYLFSYFLERFLLEFLRGDSSRFAHFTGGQWTSFVMIGISIILMMYFYTSKGFFKTFTVNNNT